MAVTTAASVPTVMESDMIDFSYAYITTGGVTLFTTGTVEYVTDRILHYLALDCETTVTYELVKS